MKTIRKGRNMIIKRNGNERKRQQRGKKKRYVNGARRKE
jgi:hypothetical protein